MLGKELNSYKVNNEDVAKKIKASFNCGRIDSFKVIG